MPRPNIQIDDEVREMTEEEHELYLQTMGDGTPIQEAPEE